MKRYRIIKMENCFVCENKNCTDKPSNICDTHKLLVCSHGFTKQYMCDGKSEKCVSLCVVQGCTKNKRYFVDGVFRGTIFSGTYVQCDEHIGKCVCGKKASIFGGGSKCIGCIEINYQFKYDASSGAITIAKKSDYAPNNQPITMLGLLSAFNRYYLDKNCILKILDNLEYV